MKKAKIRASIRRQCCPTDGLMNADVLELSTRFLQEAAAGKKPDPRKFVQALSPQDREEFMEQVGMGLLLERTFQKRERNAPIS